jgi:DNA-binding IclR family transcriptional regulator
VVITAILPEQAEALAAALRAEGPSVPETAPASMQHTAVLTAERRLPGPPSQVRTVPRMVTPFARALDLLAAFTPQDRWLSGRDLADRTGLPASTVTRLGRALAVQGYLHFAPDTRRYRLAAAVLALGYGAFANSDVQGFARTRLREFAGEHHLQVTLSTRERLDVIIVQSSSSTALSNASCEPYLRLRESIASSATGWALVAGLPQVERHYLMESIERRTGGEWPRVRRKLAEAISQVFALGYCTSQAEGSTEMRTIAAPLVIEGQAPLVVSCIGAGSQITGARLARELGPRLVAMVSSIQKLGAAP